MAHSFQPQQFPGQQPSQGQQQLHPAQMLPQHQNIGQQRQAPMAQQQVPGLGQQQIPATGQQKAMLNPNPPQNGYANYDPQFAMFTLERQKGADGWEDVEAEQQHVSAQDLLNDVKKFQRGKNTVKRVMEDIPSTNARRLINELVEEQNQDLMAMNRTLQWTIASIDIKWTAIGRNKRQLKRISVVLKTEPSGYQNPVAVKAVAGMATKVPPVHQNPAFPQPPNQGAQIAQPLRNPPNMVQPPMGHPQQPAQPMRPPPPPSHADQLPPPPPPPPGFDHPPPPPGAGMPRPPPPPNNQQHRPMPGAFPGTMHRPPMRPGQPEIEVLDPSFYKNQKKSKGRPEESFSESDSDEWESETGDSDSDRFKVRHVEHGEFAHIGKPRRGRSRNSSHSKKSRHNKSHSKMRSRSRSHGRTEYRRHRDSGLVPPPMGKYSPTSSKDSSPRSSKQQLPPIHIHMNAPTAEKPTRMNDRIRRDSYNASSPDRRKDKFTAEPMSRGSSWDRHSGTASFNDNSSVHTADDSVFSEPDRHGRRSRHHSDVVEQPPILRSRNLPYRESFGHPHPSHIYGEVEPRSRRSAYPPIDDYPHTTRQREPYYDEPVYTSRPGAHRRNSVQAPQSNPFDIARHPPRLLRSSTYGPDVHEPVYAQRESRYLTDRAAHDNIQMDELTDALEHIREQKRKPLYGRRASEYERERMSGYGGFDMYDRRGY